jgi:hypothetical protein
MAVGCVCAKVGDDTTEVLPFRRSILLDRGT